MAHLEVLLNGSPIATLEMTEGSEYFVGRDLGCHIQIADEIISRRHLRISFVSGAWHFESISKYGQIQHEGAVRRSIDLSENGSFAIGPYLFRFSKDSPQPVEEVPSEATPTDAQEPAPTGRIGEFGQEIYEPTLAVASPAASSSDSDEHTIVAGTQVGFAPQMVMTIQGPKQSRQEIAIDQALMRIGRSPTSEFVLEDPKASRTHIELRKVGNNLTVTDVGSSNGTLLNEKRMNPHQAVVLCSGDEILIGKTKIKFEIRDPSFERQLQNVPQELLVISDRPALQPYQISSPIVLQDASGKRLFHVGLAVLVLVVGYFLFSSEEETSPDTGAKTSAALEDPFLKLPEEQQRQITTAYQVAKDLYTRGRFESALFEINKIHDIIPAYKDSKEIAGLAQEGINRQREIETIEEEKRVAAKRNETITKGINKCRVLFRSSPSVGEIQKCLAPVLEFDPANAEAQQMLDSLKMAEEQRKKSQERQAEYQSQVRRGEYLFRQAEVIRGRGDYDRAIEAYGRHIASTHPDPTGLKTKSKAAISNIKSEIKAKVSALVQEAESDYANKARSQAYSKLSRAINLDPDHAKAKQLKSQIVAELFKEMKVLYSDSVLEESLGNVEQAKERWRQILATDVPGGEYYNKAKVKLKRYGG